MHHFARLTRNGHSLSVAIAPKLLEALGWHRGDVLIAGLDGDRLLLRRPKPEQLLGKTTEPAPASKPPRRTR